MPELPRTFAERVALHHLSVPSPNAGVASVVRVRPAVLMTHDNTSAVLAKFRAWGGRRVAHPEQLVFALDHDIQSNSLETTQKYAVIEAFAREQGVRFFGRGQGIGHQLMVDEGFVVPGSFVVAADSHANHYGARGAFGTAVTRTDAAAIWKTGEMWWEIPESVRCEIKGQLRPGVVGKDVIQALLGEVPTEVVAGRAVEFVGPGLRNLSIDDRLTISNMTTEWGAIAGVFLEEEATQGTSLATPSAATRSRIGTREACGATSLPQYAAHVLVDLDRVSPTVVGPNDVRRVRPLSDVVGAPIPIQKAYLLSCVNGRLRDLQEAADVVRGKRVADGVEWYVAAATAAIEAQARRDGTWETLLEAGAIPLPSGCGPCIGLGQGTLRAGETGISATNRNFPGRMGDPSAECYLASPAIVAASAIAGKIAAPSEWSWVRDARQDSERPASAGRAVEIVKPQELAVGPSKLADSRPSIAVSVGSKSTRSAPAGSAPLRASAEPGFEPVVAAAVSYFRDHVSTDEIFPSRLTYRDSLSLEELAGAAFMNAPAGFRGVARRGDILVVGRNFGTGSSREQAVTALQAFGIRAVVAASCAAIYKRNALNLGFPVVVCPAFVEAAGERGPDAAFTEAVRDALPGAVRFDRIEDPVTLDLAGGRVLWKNAIYPFAPWSAFALELILRGGIAASIQEAGS